MLPKEKRLHFSLVDYVLLAREASRLGAQAAFVSENPELQESLENLGLLCYSSLANANRSRWRSTPRTKNPEPGLLRLNRALPHKPDKPTAGSGKPSNAARWVRILLFSAAVMTVAMLGLLLVPHAQIALQTTTEQQVYRFTLQGDASQISAPLSAVIHASWLTFTVEDTITAQASGEGVFGDGFASGSVMVNNLTGQEVSIPAGLLLQTGGENPVQFRTTRAVTLAGQPADAQEVGIQAVLPGTAGNVPAGSIRGVFGDLGLSIRVENPAPTSGGTDVNAPTLTQQDVDLARRALLAQIDSQAVQQANLNLKDGQLLIARSLRRTGAAGESLSVEIGMPCRVSVLSMQTEYSAWVIPYEDLARMSVIFLDTLLPEGMQAIDQTLQFNFTDPYREKTDGFVQQVEISRAIERAVDAPALVGGLLGRKASQISSILGVPDRGSVMDVSLSPVWWPVMPFFRFQYEIVEP